MSKKIEIAEGLFATVDDDDFERLSMHNWYPKHTEHGTYARRAVYVDGKQVKMVLMHREVLGDYSSKHIDHINGNRLDNRKSNLRPATCQQNSFNQNKTTKKTSSRFKGVHLRAGGKWQAQIGYNRKRIYLGLFDTEEEAALAYDKKAGELYGEFARKNIG